MITTLIAAAVVTTQYPMVWANDYCVYRGAVKLSHEEAVEAATKATGAPTPEAWEETKSNSWCQGLEE